MLYLRAGLFYSVYVPLSIIYGSLSFFLLPLPKRWYGGCLDWWSLATIKWLEITCGISYEITGEEHVQPPKPCVYVANHQSVWETYFLQCYLMPVSTVLKKQLLSIPFFGWGLRLYHPIAIDRDNPVGALKKIKSEGIDAINAGRSVLIFPEGTRTPPNQMGAYARSAADIAKAAGVPIVPIAHNSGCFWLNKRILKLPGTIKLTVGKPITIGDQSTKAVMASIREWTIEQMP